MSWIRKIFPWLKVGGNESILGVRFSAKWPDRVPSVVRREAFEQRFNELNLRYFTAKEFLTMGGQNESGKCAKKNTFPPFALWENIFALARVWDEIRHRLGKPIHVHSVYRSPEYNKCIGGTEHSYHMQGLAADCSSPDATPSAISNIARKLRRDGVFRGGIGTYRTFVHVDIRGRNADW